VKMATTETGARAPQRAVNRSIVGGGSKLPREVMDLLTAGSATTTTLPPMVPTSRLEKPAPGNTDSSKPRSKWKWAPFTSSARSDGAVFHHWVKRHVEYPDYPYARFDVHLDPLAYENDEYERLESRLTSNWTRNETDQLMELVRKYDLRWPIIQDRYFLLMDGGEGTPSRTMEELQHRYYSIATSLLQMRTEEATQAEMDARNMITESILNSDKETTEEAAGKPIKGESTRATPQALQMAQKIQQHRIIHHFGTGTSTREFNLAKEKERRALLKVQWNRSLQEEWEEEQLLQELKLVDAQLRKLKKSGRHLLAAQETATAASGGDAMELVEEIDSSLVTAALPHQGIPYLQSARLGHPTTSKGSGLGLHKALLKKLELTLDELNIHLTAMTPAAISAAAAAAASGRSTSPVPTQSSPPKEDVPLVPTKRVCDLYDSCRKQALILLSLQKVANARETEVATKRQRLIKAQSAAEAAKARVAAQKQEVASTAAAVGAKAASKTKAVKSQVPSSSQMAAATASAAMVAATAKATAAVAAANAQASLSTPVTNMKSTGMVAPMTSMPIPAMPSSATSMASKTTKTTKPKTVVKAASTKKKMKAPEETPTVVDPSKTIKKNPSVGQKRKSTSKKTAPKPMPTSKTLNAASSGGILPSGSAAPSSVINTSVKKSVPASINKAGAPSATTPVAAVLSTPAVQAAVSAEPIKKKAKKT